MEFCNYLHLKEQGCMLLADDFDGLACPPLDLEALPIVETLNFNLSTFFDDIDIDKHGMATLKKTKKRSKDEVDVQEKPKEAKNSEKDWKDHEFDVGQEKLKNDGLAQEALFILEAMTFDPSNLFKVIVEDDEWPIILEQKTPKDHEIKTLRSTRPSDHHHRQNPKEPSNKDHEQDWNDEEKLERTKRKLHQRYDEAASKRRKSQVLDIKNLPKPPQQRKSLSKNKVMLRSKLVSCW